jgi:CDP-diacylglycerol---glycerol-3-phosphate 3-phosphatidyltransferase
MNLPNALTISRIIFVPLLVVVLLTDFQGRVIFGVPTELVGAAIFGIASITDWLDGYLARRRKQITAFGQVIDPLADKLLTCAALVALVRMNLASAWMATVIIGREFAVTTLRSVAYARGVAIPASRLGKLKMVGEVVAILALILAHGADGPRQPFFLIGRAALWTVLITALASATDYFRRFNVVLNPRVADFTAARERRGEKPANAAGAATGPRSAWRP